jgi:hypothetical protein
MADSQNEYPGEHKWLTEWLEEEERKVDVWPYAVVLFARRENDVWAANTPAGYLQQEGALAHLRTPASTIRSEARRIDPVSTRASVVVFANGQPYRVREIDL